ncbi:uncharacterized protein N7483_005782 [Penicillium malachiteum]|uniref:uncharacterized protein n=1 Tax=Penicillium malachiteum TaxID=1324776 RepID=UPI0025496B0D|nr:uncharacterized protein N7483_005782 [Penicillium malachiteum]KAJ5731274.1 hypothetical protein N7483_005782 [Penicillium malachiteum]
MSSYSDNHQTSSSQFLPPQSAQVRSSLFGGPSSDADPPPSSLPEPPRRSIFGGPGSQDVIQRQEIQSDPMEQDVTQGEETELDLILREQPLAAYYGSDGDSFHDSDDETHKPSRSVAQSQFFSTRQTRSFGTEQQPTYVVHRGVDLPPGVARPNRWIGHATNYRQAIVAERSVYNSLRALRANDLSGHLYDAFAIRQKSNHDQSEPSDADDSDEEKTRAFRKKWIAWPMTSASVPRTDENLRRRLDGFDTYRMEPDTRPSAELEEWIMATMMRVGKETYMARESGWKEVKDSQEANQTDPDPNAIVDDEAAKDDNEQNEETKKPQPKKPQSPPRHPVMQTDEDILHRQLRPLSRTVISQLDQLLMGLHHSCDIEPTIWTPVMTRQPTQMKKKQDQSRGTKRGRKESNLDQPSASRASSSRSSPYMDATDDDTQSGETPNQARKRMMDRLLLRDWSEVMGIASIMGLPSNAVERTSKRCADIFEQDMSFRTFHEGRIERLDRLPDSTYTYGYVEDSDSDFNRQPKRRTISRDTSKGPGFHNLHPPAVRASSVASSSKPQQQLAGDKNPGFGTVPANRKPNITCPIVGCKRNLSGFARTWNFKLHMKRCHSGFDYVLPSETPEPSRSPAPQPSQPRAASQDVPIIELD